MVVRRAAATHRPIWVRGALGGRRGGAGFFKSFGRGLKSIGRGVGRGVGRAWNVAKNSEVMKEIGKNVRDKAIDVGLKTAEDLLAGKSLKESIVDTGQGFKQGLKDRLREERGSRRQGSGFREIEEAPTTKRRLLGEESFT